MSDLVPQLLLDAGGVVVGAASSDLPQDGYTTVSPETYTSALSRIGLCRYVDGALSDYAPPASPMAVPDISDRQFARGLWGDGIITYADFLGFIGPGTIPAPIQAIVGQLPDDDTGAPTPRKDAVGFLTGSKLYSFSHPLVEFFREALAKDDPKWTVDYLRQQWLLWSTL